MDMKGAIEIRLLRESDLAGAGHLEAQERWNQTPDDWLRLLDLDPHGCFAADLRGRLIGTVTTVTYGDELAWVGMMLVDAAFRRRGVGARLMRAALESLERAGVRTIKLDATPAGRPLYESLGFLPEAIIQRWEGVARAATTSDAIEIEGDARATVIALDRPAFGADRSRLLEALIAASCVRPFVAPTTSGTMPRGYALARHGTEATYLGPVIATDRVAAQGLLDGLLGRLDSGRVFIDLHTGFDAGSEILTNRGFSKQRELTRMRLGGPAGCGRPDTVFAIAGPEVG